MSTNESTPHTLKNKPVLIDFQPKEVHEIILSNIYDNIQDVIVIALMMTFIIF